MSLSYPSALQFRGWPGTVRFRVPTDGGHGYRIVPFYHSPLAAPVADILLSIWTWGCLLSILVVMDEGPPEDKGRIALMIFGAMIVFAWPLWLLFRAVLASARVIEITPDAVTVLGWTGERRFGRNVPIAFELHPHWKLQRAMMYREQPKKHLIEAFHVVLRFGHESFVLVTLHGERRARKLLDRLNGVYAATAPGIENAGMHGPEFQYGRDEAL